MSSPLPRNNHSAFRYFSLVSWCVGVGVTQRQDTLAASDSVYFQNLAYSFYLALTCEYFTVTLIIF